MNLPEHKGSLCLTHNEHKDYYQTAGEWIGRGCLFDWVSDEQHQKAIETNEVWTLVWYPHTPIGSHRLAAADLDVLLEAAQQVGEPLTPVRPF